MEPLQLQIARTALTEVCKQAIQGVMKLSSFLSKEAEAQDILGKAVRQYCNRLATNFSGMKILGMSAPIPLEQIYTRVKVRDRVAKAMVWSGVDTNNVRQSEETTLQGIDVVKSKQFIAILGQPGSGKTTFLRHILFQALQNHLHRPLVPIFISLNDVSAREKVSLISLIVTQLATCFLSDTEAFVENLLQKGRCIILLDGLDEVSSSIRADVIRDIKFVSQTYSLNQFVVSCRVAAYNHWFERFSDYEVADFNAEDIKSFVHKWFADQQEVAKLCFEQLEAEQAVFSLASLPLFLVMICLSFDATHSIAPTRVELYRTAIDALLVRWDASRNVIRDEPYKQLTVPRKLSLLSEIAADTFEESDYYFRTDRIAESIAEFITQLPNSSDINPYSVLEAIEAHHGVLVERAQGIHSFSHLTFQEYFTARYHAAKGSEWHTLLIKSHAGDSRWREVIILLANLVESADDIVSALLHQLEHGMSTYHWRLVERLRPSSTSSLQLTRRQRKVRSDIDGVPSTREVAAIIKSRRNSLSSVDSMLRMMGTKVLVEFILEEGSKQIILHEQQGTKMGLQGNERAKLLATALLFACENLIPFAAGPRQHLRSATRIGGVYGNLFKSSYWTEIVAGILTAGNCLYLLDILPKQQAEELAAVLYGEANDMRTVTIYTDKTEYLSSVLECSKHLVKVLEMAPSQQNMQLFARKAENELEKSISDSTATREWSKLYIEEILLDILSSQVVMRREVREVALTVLRN